MKKYFENPMIAVSLFNEMDIVTVSGEGQNYTDAKDSIAGATNGYVTEANFDDIIEWKN